MASEDGATLVGNRVWRAISVVLNFARILGIAVWFEASVTIKWVYPDCTYPVFGWPLPNRAYSEVSSLEYFVDWFCYVVDLSIYVLASALLILAIRRYLAKYKVLNLASYLPILPGILIASAMIGFWHSSVGFPGHPLRQAGISFSPGYGKCGNPQ